MGTELSFADSCVTIEKVDCLVGSTLINPCSCQSYYRCDTNYAIINQTCASGTFYDHINNRCDTDIKVEIAEICRRDEPWLQCSNVTGADLGMLAQKCGGIYSTTTAGVTQAPGGGTGDGNTGLVVGVVVACVLVVVLLAILVYCWYKHQNKGDRKKLKDHKDSINNPNYFNKIERIDSVYAQIDDNMNTPVYNSGTLDNTRPPLPANRPPSQSSTASGIVSLDTIGPDKHKSNDIQEGAYVEPDPSRNTPRVTRSSETLDSKASVYTEVLDLPPDPEPSMDVISTPYDNSWQS